MYRPAVLETCIGGNCAGNGSWKCMNLNFQFPFPYRLKGSICCTRGFVSKLSLILCLEPAESGLQTQKPTLWHLVSYCPPPNLSK
jgi:hypothetical protein